MREGEFAVDPIERCKRSRERAALVEINPHVYIIGGNNAAALNLVERYNYETKQMSSVANMKCARRDHSACTVKHRIYVIGGRRDIEFWNNVEMLDTDKLE